MSCAKRTNATTTFYDKLWNGNLSLGRVVLITKYRKVAIYTVYSDYIVHLGVYLHKSGTFSPTEVLEKTY